MAYTSEIEKLEARFRENPKGRNFAPLADAYRKAGLVDNAIDLCESGLKLHPDYISAHIVYGRCRMDKKDDAGAEGVFRKVLDLDPENVIALKILGDLAERNQHFDEAVDWLSRLLAADPMNGDAAEALTRAKMKSVGIASQPAPAAPSPTSAPTAPGPAIRVEGLDAVANAPTAAMDQPGFSVADGLETFDGITFDTAAHASAKADGLEVQEEIELNAQQVERVEIEGLARTQYEGSGMFKLDDDVAPPAATPVPVSEPAEEPLPEVDLPLIMPEDLGPAITEPLPEPERPAATPVAPPRAATAVPAAVLLSDDDGAADAATLSQAEPVVTETMAELYLKQGHEQDALRVYQALLAQRPGDARLKARVAALGGRGGGGEGQASGVSAQAFLRGILAGRETPPAGASPEAAFEAEEAAADHPGEPTQPARDHISLDTVFGETGQREAIAESEAEAAGERGAGPAPGGGFSFDQFFSGSARTPGPGGATVQTGDGARTPGRSSGRTKKPAEDEGDLDQFQQWLKKLKS